MTFAATLESCPICGATVTSVTGPIDVGLGARRVMVEAEHLACTECGERFHPPGQVDALQREAAAESRRQDRLLTPDEIRQVRERLGMSQAAFERLLGVGAKTVVRWERGTVSQNRTTDALIRLVDAVPGVSAFLRELQAEREGVSRLSS
jgi:HTH-type transcriptional regulator/antitoxin MqsA